MSRQIGHNCFVSNCDCVSFRFRENKKFNPSYPSGLSVPKVSKENGSFKRVFNKRPNRTIRPTSTNNRSRHAKCFFSRPLRRSSSSISDACVTVSFKSCNLLQCSSMLRWNTAETRSLVICSWLIFSKLFHNTLRSLYDFRFESTDSLHDCRRASAASSS